MSSLAPSPKGANLSPKGRGTAAGGGGTGSRRASVGASVTPLDPGLIISTTAVQRNYLSGMGKLRDSFHPVSTLIRQKQLHGLEQVAHSVTRSNHFLRENLESEDQLRGFAAECLAIASQLEKLNNQMRQEVQGILLDSNHKRRSSSTTNGADSRQSSAVAAGGTTSPSVDHQQSPAADDVVGGQQHAAISFAEAAQFSNTGAFQSFANFPRQNNSGDGVAPRSSSPPTLTTPRKEELAQLDSARSTSAPPGAMYASEERRATKSPAALGGLGGPGSGGKPSTDCDQVGASMSAGLGGTLPPSQVEKGRKGKRSSSIPEIPDHLRESLVKDSSAAGSGRGPHRTPPAIPVPEGNNSANSCGLQVPDSARSKASSSSGPPMDRGNTDAWWSTSNIGISKEINSSSGGLGGVGGGAGGSGSSFTHTAPQSQSSGEILQQQQQPASISSDIPEGSTRIEVVQRGGHGHAVAVQSPSFEIKEEDRKEEGGGDFRTGRRRSSTNNETNPMGGDHNIVGIPSSSRLSAASPGTSGLGSNASGSTPSSPHQGASLGVLSQPQASSSTFLLGGGGGADLMSSASMTHISASNVFGATNRSSLFGGLFQPYPNNTSGASQSFVSSTGGGGIGGGAGASLADSQNRAALLEASTVVQTMANDVQTKHDVSLKDVPSSQLEKVLEEKPKEDLVRLAKDLLIQCREISTLASNQFVKNTQVAAAVRRQTQAMGFGTGEVICSSSPNRRKTGAGAATGGGRTSIGRLSISVHSLHSGGGIGRVVSASTAPTPRQDSLQAIGGPSSSQEPSGAVWDASNLVSVASSAQTGTSAISASAGDRKKVSVKSPKDESGGVIESQASLYMVPSFAHQPSTKQTACLEEGEDEAGFQTLNFYTVIGEAGRGSFGAVKIALNESGEQLAIKVMSKGTLKKNFAAALRQNALDAENSGASYLQTNSSLGGDGGGGTSTVPLVNSMMEAITREIEVMMKVRHQNVVPLLEVIDDPEQDVIYLVMPYIERGPLLKVSDVGTCTPLDPDVAKGYMRQLINAVQYLHERHIIHRDIKPDNVLLGEDGRVYLSDFGVSTMFRKDEAEKVGKVEGTPAFLAPECFDLSLYDSTKGFSLEGKPLDIWALGVTFFLMLYGCLPFEGANERELQKTIVEDALFFPAYIGAAGTGGASMRPSSTMISEEEELLRDLLTQMLNKNPAERATVRECMYHPSICRDKKMVMDLKRLRKGSSPHQK